MSNAITDVTARPLEHLLADAKAEVHHMERALGRSGELRRASGGTAAGRRQDMAEALKAARQRVTALEAAAELSEHERPEHPGLHMTASERTARIPRAPGVTL